MLIYFCCHYDIIWAENKKQNKQKKKLQEKAVFWLCLKHSEWVKFGIGAVLACLAFLAKNSTGDQNIHHCLPPGKISTSEHCQLQSISTWNWCVVFTAGAKPILYILCNLTLAQTKQFARFQAHILLRCNLSPKLLSGCVLLYKSKLWSVNSFLIVILTMISLTFQ